MSPASPRTATGETSWSRLLLVEGTIGVGKSTLLEALLHRHLREGRPRTVLHLTQAHTYGPLAPAEDDGTLTRDGCLSHLQRITEILEWHVRSLTHETKPKLYGLVDTLHLTHCFRPGVVSFDDVHAIDLRLAALDVGLLVLRASPQVLWERGIVARRGSGFLRYASKFGRTEQQIHAHFVREQDRLVALSERSAMRRVVLDVEDTRSEDAAWTLWKRT